MQKGNDLQEIVGLLKGDGEHKKILKNLFERVELIDINKEVARSASALYKNLQQQHLTLDIKDIFTAACAIVMNY